MITSDTNAPETRAYADGTIATGPAPLPQQSPQQQDSGGALPRPPGLEHATGEQLRAHYERGAASRPLPTYRSFKTVYALKIADLEEQRPQVQDGRSAQSAWATFLHFEDHTWPARLMPADWISKHRPQVGGYWVQYEDGYESFSPAKAFEGGYILAADWGPRYLQDPKYTVDPATGRRINGDTRQPVPDDEPTMMFRAKDAMALEALTAYRHALGSQLNELPDDGSAESLERAERLCDTLQSVDERIAAFRAFRESHQDVLRNPT